MIDYKNLSYDLIKAKNLEAQDTILVGTKLLYIEDIRFCVGMGHFEYGEYITVSGFYLERHSDGWKQTSLKASFEDFYLYREQPVIKVTDFS